MKKTKLFTKSEIKKLHKEFNLFTSLALKTREIEITEDEVKGFIVLIKRLLDYIEAKT